jgi:hypothetical protein
MLILFGSPLCLRHIKVLRYTSGSIAYGIDFQEVEAIQVAKDLSTALDQGIEPGSFVLSSLSFFDQLLHDFTDYRGTQ